MIPTALVPGPGGTYHVPMATRLTRTVRFCLNGDGSLSTDAPTDNSFAAWPPMRGLGRYYEIDVTCAGAVEPTTGYMVNIKHIDKAVRARVLPAFASVANSAGPAIGALLRQATADLTDELDHRVVAVRLQLAPTYAITYEEHDMGAAKISQQFDFSAAHRLHVDELGDEQNRLTFGKCNNPNGHGHNYRVEVTARCPIDDAGRVAPVEQLDAIVNRVIVEPFDHKHLNLDTDEFASLNPSVENIAKVFYERLEAPIADAGLRLDEVCVWETEKTCARFGR